MSHFHSRRLLVVVVALDLSPTCVGGCDGRVTVVGHVCRFGVCSISKLVARHWGFLLEWSVGGGGGVGVAEQVVYV